MEEGAHYLSVAEVSPAQEGAALVLHALFSSTTTIQWRKESRKFGGVFFSDREMGEGREGKDGKRQERVVVEGKGMVLRGNCSRSCSSCSYTNPTLSFTVCFCSMPSFFLTL